MTRQVSDKEMTILAAPIVAAIDSFPGDTQTAMLAVFTLGLDIGRKDPALAARMSEIGQATLTGGEALDEQMLDTTIVLANLLFVVLDAENATK